MALEYKFTSITSTGGETIDLPATGVVCIVGGNNVGKSQLLRELRQLVYERDDASSFRVVARATATDLSADEAESLAWLEERATEYDTTPGQPRRFAFRISEPGTSVEEFRFWLDKDQTYVGNIAPFFVEYAPAGTLAKYAEGYIESDLQSPSNFALLKLRGDGELEEELSNLSVEAFGTALLFDRLDAQPRLRVGSVLEEPPPVNRPTRSYARAVAALDTLDGQGDGMRSFVGLASQVITHRMDVLLVDEPEAFLHPGQARAYLAAGSRMKRSAGVCRSLCRPTTVTLSLGSCRREAARGRPLLGSHGMVRYRTSQSSARTRSSSFGLVRFCVTPTCFRVCSMVALSCARPTVTVASTAQRWTTGRN